MIRQKSKDGHRPRLEGGHLKMASFLARLARPAAAAAQLRAVPRAPALSWGGSIAARYMSTGKSAGGLNADVSVMISRLSGEEQGPLPTAGDVHQLLARCGFSQRHSRDAQGTR